VKRYWENLRPFEKRVVVGVAAGLFALFNLWFIFPHFSDLGRMQGRLEDARRKLERRQAAIAQTGFYEGEIRKLQKEGLDVPAEDQAAQFSRTITEEEMRSGVNPIGEGRIIANTNNQFFVEQSKTINVQSGEQQLVDFLFNLGSGNSLIRVRDLGLHPDPQTRQQLAGTIKLVASFQKNPTAKPAGSAGKTGSTKPAATPAPASRPIAAPSPTPSSPPPQPGKKTTK